MQALLKKLDNEGLADYEKDEKKADESKSLRVIICNNINNIENI
jgi:hypothetical protein